MVDPKEVDKPKNLVEGGRVDKAQKKQSAEQLVQHEEQQAQAIRQTKQGLRQDQQGIRQDGSQEQQNATDKITNEHTQQILAVQERQEQADYNLDRVIEGVDLLLVQTTTLNERVYTKNYLDKVRNWLIAGFVLVFLIVSFCLGYLLVKQSIESRNRAKDAALSRRQIADCTVKPGVVLDDGYVNPGKCYTEGANRTGEAVSQLTSNISEQVKELLENRTPTTNRKP